MKIIYALLQLYKEQIYLFDLLFWGHTEERKQDTSQHQCGHDELQDVKVFVQLLFTLQ